MEDKRTLAAVKQAVYYRNYRRARDRALRRLSNEHPEEYLQLLQEERVRDEENGKTWGSVGITIVPPGNSRFGESSYPLQSKQVKYPATTSNDEGEE